jgi:type IV pilus assembly protein PilB
MTAKEVAAEWGLPYLNIDDIAEESISLSLLPREIIEQYTLLPLSDNRLVLGDITQLKHLPEIHFHHKTPFQIYLTDKEKLKQKLGEMLHQQQHEYLLNDDEASIVQYVEKMLSNAVNKKASDIHLDIWRERLVIRFRIDGILYIIAELSSHFASRIITHLKVMAQLDITEKRLPQDGRLRIALNQQSIDFRISTCPTLHHEKMVLRLLNIHTQPLEVDLLGFSETQKKLFLTAIHKPQGMVLVTGPTGSGKTITLYTALHLLNKPAVNILSVEDPIEIELPGVNQVHMNDKISLTFSTVLRSFLRQDPDIIMVGEMRDKETADIAIKAAQTGHLVLSTLHTNSATETLTRLMNMGIPAYDIAASISLIIAQRLVRKLCIHCQGQHCRECQKGYSGRTAVYEFLRVTPAITETILHTPDALSLERKACEEGMQTLYAHGLEKVGEGITSLAELSRVLQC